MPRRPAIIVIRPTLDWLQCCCVTRKTLRYGPTAPRTSASKKLIASSEDCLKPSFFGAVVTGSVRQQCRADRQQQRGRHHEHSEFEEHGGADVQSLAAKCGEPQNGRE